MGCVDGRMNTLSEDGGTSGIHMGWLGQSAPIGQRVFVSQGGEGDSLGEEQTKIKFLGSSVWGLIG